MTLLVSLTTYILASLHSHTSHISRITTLPHSHLAWEFEKPFIISFITLRFIQPKIKELISFWRFWSFQYSLLSHWLTSNLMIGKICCWSDSGYLFAMESVALNFCRLTDISFSLPMSVRWRKQKQKQNIYIYIYIFF